MHNCSRGQVHQSSGPHVAASLNSTRQTPTSSATVKWWLQDVGQCWLSETDKRKRQKWPKEHQQWTQRVTFILPLLRHYLFTPFVKHTDKPFIWLDSVIFMVDFRHISPTSCALMAHTLPSLHQHTNTSKMLHLPPTLYNTKLFPFSYIFLVYLLCDSLGCVQYKLLLSVFKVQSEHSHVTEHMNFQIDESVWPRPIGKRDNVHPDHAWEITVSPELSHHSDSTVSCRLFHFLPSKAHFSSMTGCNRTRPAATNLSACWLQYTYINEMCFL